MIDAPRVSRRMFGLLPVREPLTKSSRPAVYIVVNARPRRNRCRLHGREIFAHRARRRRFADREPNRKTKAEAVAHLQLFGRDALAVGTVLAAPPVRGLAPAVAEMCCAITYDAAILGFMVLPPTPEYEQFSRREIDRPLTEPPISDLYFGVREGPRP
jgi:hypothetical protein